MAKKKVGGLFTKILAMIGFCAQCRRVASDDGIRCKIISHRSLISPTERKNWLICGNY